MIKKIVDSIKSFIERQELWCHSCSRYVQFDMDLSLDGNHVLKCPNCSHEHCRVVRKGKITDIRWASRNGPTINITSTSMTFSATSTATSCTSGNHFLYQSWNNSTSNY